MSVKNSTHTIAEKTQRLNEFVLWFDSENFELELALDKFKQAQTLAEEIESDLMSLKNEILVVKQRFDEVE
jgi:exonuclease VII small subunit